MLNRSKWFYLALAAMIFITGCSLAMTPSSESSPSPTAVRNVLATRKIIVPSPVPLTVTAVSAPTSAPTALPAPTETIHIAPTGSSAPSSDNFCCLYFAAGPYGQATDTFPAGTEIIYAIWDYKALSPGDRIRRIWIRDGLIWLPRVETWDWDKYGASGTVRDLSIFDFEGTGLRSATYQLQLYLNDELQEEGTFVILPP